MNTKISSSALLALTLCTPLGVWAAGENHTEESCLATFSVSDQTLTIPCVEVVMGNETVLYSAQLQQVEEGRFALTQVAELSAAMESDCVANYSLETGELVVPCIDMGDPSLNMDDVVLQTDDPSNPLLFSKLDRLVRQANSGLLTTPTGMYYPANTTSRGGYLGWWSQNSDFGNACHLGVDFQKNEDEPIYAVWDGTVRTSSMNVGKYGSFGGVGGAMVIEHRTSDGTVFYALYGHLKNLQFRIGDWVQAGKRIADVGEFNVFVYNPQTGKKDRVASWPHLHFGINSRTTSVAGYTDNAKCSDAKGFVNPVSFIETRTGLLSAPKITYPANGATLSSMTTTFQWRQVTTANNYRIIISQNSSFSGFKDAGGNSTCDATCFTTATTDISYPNKTMDKRGWTYYVKVRAANGTFTSSWSPVVSFKTPK